MYNYDHNFFGGPGADEALLSDAAAAARVEAERGDGEGEAGRGKEVALGEAAAAAGAAGSGSGGKHRDPFHVRLSMCVRGCVWRWQSKTPRPEIPASLKIQTYMPRQTHVGGTPGQPSS